MSRLKDLYKNEIMDAMTKKFGYKNVMEVPKLEKIVVNMGVGWIYHNSTEHLIVYVTVKMFYQLLSEKPV